MGGDSALRASRAVARLTHREPDLDRLRTDLDRALRALIGRDVAAWATTDPATVIFTSCVLLGREENLGLEARLFELEFTGGDINTFAELARRPVPVAALHASTAGQLHHSRRYRELLADIGVVDELRAAFVEHGQCWGTLIAYRQTGPAFTAEDLALVAAVGPAIAAGLRLAMLHAAVRHPPPIGPFAAGQRVGADQDVGNTVQDHLKSILAKPVSPTAANPSPPCTAATTPPPPASASYPAPTAGTSPTDKPPQPRRHVRHRRTRCARTPQRIRVGVTNSDRSGEDGNG